jgi:hypothetical protein
MKLGLIFFKAAEEQKEGIYTNSLFLNNAKGKKITNSFSIEGVLVKFDKNQVLSFIANLTKNSLKLPW